MTANFQIRVFGHGTEITVNEIIRIATPERERPAIFQLNADYLAYV